MRDTRSELLEQAEILVRRQGYSGFSYADLEQVIGIRKASIHYHFRTKETLALALVESYGRRYDQALATIRASHSGALERVDAYGRLYLEGLGQDLGCLCAVLAVERHTLPSSLRAAVAAFFRNHIIWLEEVLAEGGARGEIGAVEPAVFARMIVGALEGALLMERVLEGEKGFEATLAALRASLTPAARS